MLEFGIVRAGMISRSGYDGPTKSGAADVHAIADVNEPRRKDFAARNKVPRQFRDAPSLLREKNLDAVSIAVPDAFHAPFAIAAPEASSR
jgi:predicted dehydrogenase